MTFQKLTLTCLISAAAMLPASSCLVDDDLPIDPACRQAAAERPAQASALPALPSCMVAAPSTTININKESAAASGKADDVISVAMRYLGAPYRHGQSSPRGFDCSGFTSYVYNQFDTSLSRSSRTQFTQGERVASVQELRKGDLVFFSSPSSGRSVGHVGIVTDVQPDGNFKFVHAARGGVTVTDFRKTAYYTRRYLGARRVLQ